MTNAAGDTSALTRSRELASRLVPRLRAYVFLVRRLSLDQPITPAQMSILTVLAGGSARMGALAQELGVRLPTVTGLVDRLERQGAVERGPDPDDRRVVRVAITPEGRALRASVGEVRGERLARRLAALPEEDREALEAALPVLDRLVRD